MLTSAVSLLKRKREEIEKLERELREREQKAAGRIKEKMENEREREQNMEIEGERERETEKDSKSPFLLSSLSSSSLSHLHTSVFSNASIPRVRTKPDGSIICVNSAFLSLLDLDPPTMNTLVDAHLTTMFSFLEAQTLSRMFAQISSLLSHPTQGLVAEVKGGESVKTKMGERKKFDLMCWVSYDGEREEEDQITIENVFLPIS